MTVRFYSTLAALTLAASALSATSAARAQSQTTSDTAASREAVVKAKKLIDEAMKHYARADWEGARELLLEALAVKPHRSILGNLAEVEIRTGRYLDAARHLQRLLAELPENATERRDAALAQLAVCREHLSSIQLTIGLEGANVRLNDESLGESPITQEVFVLPGTVNITVEHPDYYPVTRTVEAHEGKREDIAIQLVGKAKAPVAPSPSLTSSSHASVAPPVSNVTRNVIVISGASLAAVGITAGIILWWKGYDNLDKADALNAAMDAEDPGNNSQCFGTNLKDPESCAKLHELAKRSDRQVNWGTASFVGAGVAAAAATFTYLLWPKAKSSETGVPAKAANVEFEPWATRDVQGLQLRGTF
ncbi:MAG: PEGA domain-containing protein [Polyangiaceae bacterium]